jgi:hypothetical protein
LTKLFSHHQNYPKLQAFQTSQRVSAGGTA